MLYRTYKLSSSARVCISRYNTAAHVVNSTVYRYLLISPTSYKLIDYLNIDQASTTGGLGSVKAEVMADTSVALATANVQVVSSKFINRLLMVRFKIYMIMPVFVSIVMTDGV